MHVGQDERVRSASAARREREKRKTRASILAAARKQFDAAGYEGLSLRRVAEDAGYTPTTIYLYFKDKDELLYSITEVAHDEFVAELRAAQESTADPLRRIREIGRAYLDFGLRNPDAYKVVFMYRPDFLSRSETGSTEKRSDALDILRQAVAEASAAGVLVSSDVDAVVDALWAAVHGAVSLSLAMPQLYGASSPERSLTAVLDVCIRGIAAPDCRLDNERGEA